MVLRPILVRFCIFFAVMCAIGAGLMLGAYFSDPHAFLMIYIVYITLFILSCMPLYMSAFSLYLALWKEAKVAVRPFRITPFHCHFLCQSQIFERVRGIMGYGRTFIFEWQCSVSVTVKQLSSISILYFHGGSRDGGIYKGIPCPNDQVVNVLEQLRVWEFCINPQ
jgi:hypothetical protein